IEFGAGENSGTEGTPRFLDELPHHKIAYTKLQLQPRQLHLIHPRMPPHGIPCRNADLCAVSPASPPDPFRNFEMPRHFPPALQKVHGQSVPEPLPQRVYADELAMSGKTADVRS